MRQCFSTSALGPWAEGQGLGHMEGTWKGHGGHHDKALVVPDKFAFFCPFCSKAGGEEEKKSPQPPSCFGDKRRPGPCLCLPAPSST
jgi:hypothetical protein